MAVKAKKRNEPKAKTKTKTKAKAKSNPKFNLPLYTPSKGPEHYHFWFKKTEFNILPEGIFHPIIASHLTQFPMNLTNRYNYLISQFPIKMPVGIERPDIIDWTYCSPSKSAAIRKAVGRIMRVRFLFRKLLHHMRVRRLKVANLEDIVTMEPPKKRIELVDWQSKQKYLFEASTLMKDITCRLMTHDGFFENQQEPRNPFTNIPFTQSQAISVWNSISSAGIPVSVAFTAYRQSRYSLTKFALLHSTFIKLNALKETMKLTSSFSYKERMLDFISYCYEQEDLNFNMSAFTYCIYYYPNYPQIKRWSALCYKYYEAEILYSANPESFKKARDSVLDSSIHLLNSDSCIINLSSVAKEIIPENSLIVDVFLLS
jgi:hypothetical protein